MLVKDNIGIPKEVLPKVLEIVLNGGTGADIYRAGIKNSNGTPVSERQARRYRQIAETLIESLDEKTLIALQKSTYLKDISFDDEDTSFPPVIPPVVTNRSCVFDIEVLSPSFNLMGKYSHYLLCASFFPLDKDQPYSLTIEYDADRDDRYLLKAVINELSNYMFVIGHNVKGYDINWIKTRIMFYGWPEPNIRFFYYDTYSALKRVPLLYKKDLGSILDFFRIKSATKTKIMPIEWDKVRSPHKKDFQEAMEVIKYHCEEDVKANKEIYNILMGLKYDPKPSWKLWPH